MPVLRFILLFSGLFVTFSAISDPAEALRVKNRDAILHRVSLSSTPGEGRVVEIAPGGSYTTHSPAITLQLLTGDHPTTIHAARFYDEYSIWPDGHLYLQNRRPPRDRAF